MGTRQKKKTGLIVFAVVMAAAIVGGVMLYLFFSPQLALSGMVKEINQKGLPAAEKYLTGNAKTAYDKVNSVIQNPLTALIARTSSVESVVGEIAEGAGKLKVSYRSMKRGWNTASASLWVETPAADGEIQLEMERKGFSWLISDVAIPIGSWIFQN